MVAGARLTDGERFTVNPDGYQSLPKWANSFWLIFVVAGRLSPSFVR